MPLGRLLGLALGRLLLLCRRHPSLAGCRPGVDRLVVGGAGLGLRGRRPLRSYLVRPILLLAFEILLTLRLGFALLLVAVLLGFAGELEV